MSDTLPTISTRKLVVNVKGVPTQFETPYTNDQVWVKAKALVAAKPERMSFLSDLIAKGIKYKRLSPMQWNWVHKIVVDSEKPDVRPEGIDESLMGVIELFDRAAEKLKRPAITFDFDGKVIQLKRTNGGQYPGSVYVTDGGGYGNSTCYARIERDGKLTTYRAFNEEVRTVCRLLSTDPVKIATEYGLKTGNCCFCNKKLEVEKSTEVGYGPVCAKNYGLPWGTRAARKAVHPVIGAAASVEA